MRHGLFVPVLSAILALAACGGTDDTTDNGAADVVADARDSGRTDARLDLPRTDNPVTDNPVADNPVTDTPVTDTPVTDTPVTDTPVTDTPVTDTPGTDVPVTACEGACNPETDSTRCLADAAQICYCNPETNAWEPYGCAEVCTANNMKGDQCVVAEGKANCNCEYDCTNSEQVQAQCADMGYNPCTCGAADPCSWQGDGYCDGPCATYFPDDHFVDTADCTCTGACNPEEFGAFCDTNNNPCNCEGGNKTAQPCTTYCTDLGATVSATEPCAASLGGAYCNCENFDCGNATKVQAQCTAGLYTPCTCGVADPCGWAADPDYCDTPSCNQLFPDQSNFDDGASAPCQR